MADRYVSDTNPGSYFKEAVCIDAMRVYDSCADKDCLEDIRVLVAPEQQQLIDCAKDVRIRDANVIAVYTDVSELPFNKGRYTVDITFFIEVYVELLGNSQAPVIPLTGLCIFNKKCVLYGSEGGVKTFYSDDSREFITGATATPKASVQVAEPVALSARLCENKHHHGHCHCYCGDDGEGLLPEAIRRRYGNLDMDATGGKGIYATIGLFFIIQMIRNVQMLIPAYDFCVPTKECSCGTSNTPCDLFSAIDFPTDEFFPPKADESNGNGSCGCK